MGLPNKPGVIQQLAIASEPVPNLPALPEPIQSKFSDLKDYEASMQKFWQNFSDQLARHNQQIQQQISQDETSSAQSLASIRTSIETLTAQIAAVSSQISGDSPLSVQVAALATKLAALTAELDAHVGSAIAHGTLSNVVGVSDEQSLDSKTIGAAMPRYGRFSALVSRNRIEAGQSVTVNAGDSMIVAAPFEVFGSLIVAGTLVAV